MTAEPPEWRQQYDPAAQNLNGPSAQLYAALSEFQAELVSVPKSASNPFYKSSYAPLDAIQLAATPILTKHGLAVSQLPSHIDGAPALRTIVMHVSGQSIEATCPLSLVKNDPQSMGSAITYLRRYAYCAALGIVVDGDDDGNATRPKAAKATKAARPTQADVDQALDGATQKQIGMIQGLMRDAGVTERDDILANIAGIIGRDVKSSKEMTRNEASMVIEALSGRSTVTV